MTDTISRVTSIQLGKDGNFLTHRIVFLAAEFLHPYPIILPLYLLYTKKNTAELDKSLCKPDLTERTTLCRGTQQQQHIQTESHKRILVFEASIFRVDVNEAVSRRLYQGNCAEIKLLKFIDSLCLVPQMKTHKNHQEFNKRILFKFQFSCNRHVSFIVTILRRVVAG